MASLARYRRFIGIPYEYPHGCFRIIQRVFQEEYNINMPNYVVGVDEGDRTGLAEVYFKHLVEGCQEVETPEEGDLIGFRLTRIMYHIGLVVEPQKCLMLHCYPEAKTVIESYDSMKFRTRIDGFFRYISEDTSRGGK